MHHLLVSILLCVVTFNKVKTMTHDLCATRYLPIWAMRANRLSPRVCVIPPMGEELCKQRGVRRTHWLRLDNNLSRWAQLQEVAWSLSDYPCTSLTRQASSYRDPRCPRLSRREKELCDLGIGMCMRELSRHALTWEQTQLASLEGRGAAEPILGLSSYDLSSSRGRNAHCLPPIHSLTPDACHDSSPGAALWTVTLGILIYR